MQLPPPVSHGIMRSAWKLRGDHEPGSITCGIATQPLHAAADKIVFRKSPLCARGGQQALDNSGPTSASAVSARDCRHHFGLLIAPRRGACQLKVSPVFSVHIESDRAPSVQGEATRTSTGEFWPSATSEMHGEDEHQCTPRRGGCCQRAKRTAARLAS